MTDALSVRVLAFRRHLSLSLTQDNSQSSWRRQSEVRFLQKHCAIRLHLDRCRIQTRFYNRDLNSTTLDSCKGPQEEYPVSVWTHPWTKKEGPASHERQPSNISPSNYRYVGSQTISVCHILVPVAVLYCRFSHISYLIHVISIMQCVTTRQCKGRN